MNSQIILAIIVTFSVMTFSMVPLQQQILQNAFAQDDESDTDTEQRLRQKNTGSGDSANFNCSENLIDSTVSVICVVEPPPPPPETATLSVCKEMASGSLGAPNNFAFTVTGNGPEPDEFLGDANCVEASIGPGEYAVSEVNMFGGFLSTPQVEGQYMQDSTNVLRATGGI